MSFKTEKRIIPETGGVFSNRKENNTGKPGGVFSNRKENNTGNPRNSLQTEKRIIPETLEAI